MVRLVVLSEPFRLFLELHRQSRELVRARGGYPGDMCETPEEVELNGQIAQQWGDLSNEDATLWLQEYRENPSFWESL